MSKYGAPNPSNIGAGAATAGGIQPPVNFKPTHAAGPGRTLRQTPLGVALQVP